MSQTHNSLSVIVCAYTDDRWANLTAAVQSIRQQTLLPTELIVVIDHNPALLLKAQAYFTDAHVVENTEPQGLSGARNSGIAVSGGELVAFLDDDAVAHPDWLLRLTEALQNPDVIGAGGHIIPQWEHERPRWLPEEFYWVIGCTHRGTPPYEVRNLVGANMLIRRSAFDAVGSFRAEIGRVGTIPLGCEETELCIRIRQYWHNAKFLYVAAASIQHFVPAKRTRFAYFRSRCYAEGISKALVAQMVGSKDGLSAERSYVLKTLPAGVLRGVADTLLRRDARGTARSMAIIIGLLITTLGYVRGKLATLTQVSRTANPLLADEVQSTDRKLRILMVAARFFPFAGGTETHVYEVARRMVAEGHEVIVLTANPGSRFPPTEIKDGIQIRRVAAYPADRDYYFAPALLPIIMRGNWDVMHLQGYHTLVAPTAMAAAWLSGLPYAVTFHSGGHSSNLRNSARGIQRQLLRPLLMRAKQLVGVSKFEAELFSESLNIPRDQFVVVPNGSNMPRVDSADCPEPIMGELIVSPGRLERYKGHHHAIAALPKVLAQRPNVRLRIVGAGPYEQDLRKLTSQLGLLDKVEIGSIAAENRTGMASLLSQASLVVLFSDYEAHPVAVMEALSLQRSVLVTDTSGLRELAQSGYVNAIPIESSAEEVAEAILNQLDHPLTPTTIALPTWDECASQLLTIYRRITIMRNVTLAGKP